MKDNEKDANRIEAKEGDAPPRILKAVITRKAVQSTRRNFFRQVFAGAATTVAAGAATACGTSSYDVQVDDAGKCRCHAVCVCDSEGEEGRQMEARYDGNICTCNQVCACDTVCTCNSEGGSSGGTYYYPV